MRLFTTRYPGELRRGLGFDMKNLDEDKRCNLAEDASPRTFGHLGFTGTAVWADPDDKLVYVFLSNRTYPSMENNKLGRMNTRVKAMAAAYEAMAAPAPSPRSRPAPVSSASTARLGQRP